MPTFLILSYALTFGYLPSSAMSITDRVGDPNTIYQAGSMMQTIEIGMTAFDLVTVWTNIETYDYQESVFVYRPFRSDYNIGVNAGKDIAGFRFDAGIKHECVHPVITGPVQKVRFTAGETEIYFKVSGKIGGER